MSGIMSRFLLNASFVDTEVQDGKLVYIFDKKQHIQALLHNLSVMQDNEEESPSHVVIISKEDEQFHFHAPILAALSKKLEEHLLKQDLGSATSKTVIEEEFSSEAIQCLWDYAYTSVVTLTPSNIDEVKELAEHHGLDNLKNECEVLQERFEDYCDGVELEFKNLMEFILNRLYGFLASRKFCSAAITGSDSLSRAPCHGAVVTAACNAFAYGGTTENLQVNDAMFQVIAPFLRYLYTANLIIDPSTVQQLLEIAATFDLPGMGHACCCWLEDALAADNALGIMSIAQAWQAKINEQSSLYTETKDAVTLSTALDDLYQSARSFALSNFLIVQENDEYLEISMEELIDLIVDDDLVVDSEEDVFYAAMKWVEIDSETRGEKLPNLLQSVRLEHMSVRFLETIMEHDLIKTNSLCVEVVERALKELRQDYPFQYGTEEKEEEIVKVNQEAEYFGPDFSPRNSDPPFSYQTPPDYGEFNLNSSPDVYTSPPFDTSSLPAFFDQPYDGESLQETPFPRNPDMRLRRNREAFLERGKNIDGTPDKRLRENRTKNSVARKLTYADEDLPRRKDGQPDRRFKVVKELEQSNGEAGNLASNSAVPRRKDGKPDMRFRVNKMNTSKQNGKDATLKLLPQGPTRKDGKPDMRFKANRFPKQGVLCTGPTRKDGQPDMRYKANKQNVNIEYLTSHGEVCRTGPKKKDGTPDMRFAENKTAVASSVYSSGPLKKDGTPDRRFTVNKLPSNREAKPAQGPLKNNGTPDMRFAANKCFSGSSSSSGPLKKDGTPDMRYSSNRSSSDSSGPLKKDGTPDMRYRSNQSSSSSSFGSACSSFSGSTSSISSGHSSAGRGPLKKDGTPDMRYRSNKASNSNGFGTGWSSFGGSTLSGSSNSSRSYAPSAACGPLKKDGTPDMRYRSNNSSSSSSISSGSWSSGWSTSSFSSGYSGSSRVSGSSGPLKKDGTPDMRYKANRR